MLINRFCFLSLIAFSFASFAAEVPSGVRGIVVVTPGMNAAESKAYATTHDRLLLSDYLETSRPGEDHERQLKNHLEKAQRAWLGGETETARAEFRDLTEMSLKADWRDSQREVLQTAYLRLAQMSDSGTEREGWLESAARLYGDISPTASLFPPPLLSEYEAARKRLALATVDIDLREVFPDFKYVIVDGRKIDLATSGALALTPGLHRLTAYSDSHEAATEFLTASQLRVLRLSPPSLTDGVCADAKLRSRADLPSSMNIDIYSGANCPHDLSKVLRTSQFISEPMIETSIPDAPMATAKKRTWLWILGGAVIAGAGYALVTHHDAAPEPVHRVGF